VVREHQFNAGDSEDRRATVSNQSPYGGAKQVHPGSGWTIRKWNIPSGFEGNRTSNRQVEAGRIRAKFRLRRDIVALSVLL
jgi:hypothetical protein